MGESSVQPDGEVVKGLQYFLWDSADKGENEEGKEEKKEFI